MFSQLNITQKYFDWGTQWIDFQDTDIKYLYKSNKEFLIKLSFTIFKIENQNSDYGQECLWKTKFIATRLQGRPNLRHNKIWNYISKLGDRIEKKQKTCQETRIDGNPDKPLHRSGQGRRQKINWNSP